MNYSYHQGAPGLYQQAFLEDRIEIESYLTGSLWETNIAGWY